MRRKYSPRLREQGKKIDTKKMKHIKKFKIVVESSGQSNNLKFPIPGEPIETLDRNGTNMLVLAADFMIEKEEVLISRKDKLNPKYEEMLFLQDIGTALGPPSENMVRVYGTIDLTDLPEYGPPAISPYMIHDFLMRPVSFKKVSIAANKPYYPVDEVTAEEDIEFSTIWEHMVEEIIEQNTAALSDYNF